MKPKASAVNGNQGNRLLEQILKEMDQKLDNIAKKEDVDKLLALIEDVFKANLRLTEEVDQLKRANFILTRKMSEYDQATRKGNVVVHGLDVKNSNESAQETAENLIRSIVNENDVQVIRVRELGDLKSSQNPLLVELSDPSVIPALLSANNTASKSPKPHVTFKKDMSKEARIGCARSLKLRWHLKTRFPEMASSMKVRHDSLLISKKLFCWLGEQFICEDGDGLSALNRIFGKDLTEVILEIQKPQDSRRCNT